MSIWLNSWTQMGEIRRREARAGFLFILPWLLSLLIFTVYPLLATIYLSFTDYSIVESPKWAGLNNYSEMFTVDPSFWLSVYNSAYYALFSVPVGLVASLAVALVLNLRAAGIGLYRTLFYLPAVVPPIVSTLVFFIMFDPQSGPINNLLRMVGLPGPSWFADPVWAKPGLVLLSLWGIGVSTMIFLAGLQDIPQTLLEAAEIDGAGPWQKFRHITLPLLTPVILFNLVMGVIYSFQVFTQALVIGGTTGKPVESTLMFMVLIYRSAFRYFKMGYASALAMVLFVVILALTLLIFRTARVWVFYESDDQAV
ncbi:MAG: sugar ABC transporter permease [Anaerolineae bacterium]|nr:sugar ABC transporter permease [Anaerolineae bacterium]